METGTKTETETKTVIGTEMETKTEMETETEAETVTEMETKMKTGTEMETKTAMETATETETGTKMETKAKTGTEMETKTETETGTGTGTETGTEMQTEKAAAAQLPQFVVISESIVGRLLRYNDDAPIIGEPLTTVFNPMVKIEVERAKSNPNHVHLRFCHSNKYMNMRHDYRIVSTATEPEEDASILFGTLFSFERAGTTSAGTPTYSIVQVGSGWRLRGLAGEYFVMSSSTTTFEVIDWSTLVNLPPHVAFKGYNGKYLRAVTLERNNYHRFDSDDPNEEQCGYEVHNMFDGHLRIRSDHWGMFWKRSPNWIWGDGGAWNTMDRDTLFWPVLLEDHKTIALRCAANNMFCMALTAQGKVDCLNAGSSRTTDPTRLVVEELVNGGKIYNIKYRMEHARIFNETPYLAGSNSVTNHSDNEASMDVEISYTNEMSNTFSNSISIMAGISKTFEGGIPWIFQGSIEVYTEGTYTREWGRTLSTSQTVKASGSVVVPPRSVGLISYVGARGTCNVPFSYTQQDRSSTTGEISNNDKIDGIFEGVNNYNFQFVLTSTRSL